MEKPDVALTACSSYQRELVEEQVSRVFKLLGGPEKIIGKGKSVFIKFNNLAPKAPEAAVTTHPEVVRAVLIQLKPVTSKIIIGDCPSGPANKNMLKMTYQKTGMVNVAEEIGVELNYNTSGVYKSIPHGKSIKRILLSRPMVEADHLISISKLKTAVSMNISCAIKCLYGAVPGLTKIAYHGQFTQEKDFANVLVDVHLAAAPDFNLVDAIEGMEGNGPSSGEVRKIGVIAAGANAFALDTAMADLVSIDPRVNRPLEAAIERGIFSGRISDINMLGDDIDSLRVADFKLPDKVISRYGIYGLLQLFGKKWLLPKPYPAPGLCSGCAKCIKTCPPGAMDIVDKVAVVDYKKCIKCYCCQEVCEYGAVKLKHSWFVRRKFI